MRYILLWYDIVDNGIVCDDFRERWIVINRCKRRTDRAMKEWYVYTDTIKLLYLVEWVFDECLFDAVNFIYNGNVNSNFIDCYRIMLHRLEELFRRIPVTILINEAIVDDINNKYSDILWKVTCERQVTSYDDMLSIVSKNKHNIDRNNNK